MLHVRSRRYSRFELDESIRSLEEVFWILLELPTRFQLSRNSCSSIGYASLFKIGELYVPQSSQRRFWFLQDFL